ncbi:MAG: hypothetical protein K6E96_07360 [Bacteroidales bacterium]|jgi:hypothetical protein|nr:hypothetical protein [Bacteroidales bacterium]
MGDYDDIINLPHHQSRRHPHMTLYDRAAQFAPFAALNGHSAVIANATERHIDDVNAPQFETDYLLSLLSEQEYKEDYE